MDVPWDQAEGHLKKLDYPNLGYSGDWDDWYQWLEECSRVLVTGEPEVNLPDSNAEGTNESL